MNSQTKAKETTPRMNMLANIPAKHIIHVHPIRAHISRWPRWVEEFLHSLRERPGKLLKGEHFVRRRQSTAGGVQLWISSRVEHFATLVLFAISRIIYGFFFPRKAWYHRNARCSTKIMQHPLGYCFVHQAPFFRAIISFTSYNIISRGWMAVLIRTHVYEAIRFARLFHRPLFILHTRTNQESVNGSRW